MKILITGIYGFLGARLAEQLAAKHRVSGLYHTSKRKLSVEIPAVQSLDDITEAPDAIVMCHAAVSSGTTQLPKAELQEVNVDLTARIVRKFPRAKIIYVSSVSVFGFPDDVVTEQSVVCPPNDYAASKYEGEQVVSQNPDHVMVRFSSLYGEGMKENTLIPNYVRQALSAGQIEVWGTGARLQNYIHVSDAVALIERIIETTSPIDVPLLGVSAQEYTNLEVANIIAKQTGAAIVHVQQDASPSVKYNNIVTQKVLNWKPETTLEKGIVDYIKWKEKQS